jgi:hypothetical protein
MSWKIKHKLHDGTVLETIQPENLRFTLNKKDVHTIQYEISHSKYGHTGDVDIHDFVGAYRTDFELIWHDDVGILGDNTILAGMHVPAVDVGREDGYTTLYGKDWKHYLSRRHYPFDPTSVNAYQVPGSATGYAREYAGVDVATIIKDLLDVTLGMPYSLDITYPTLTTTLGIPINFQLALADTTDILSFIDQFSNIDPGFDYEIDHFKELRLFTPKQFDLVGVTTGTTASKKAACSYVFDATNADLISEGPKFTNNGPLATHWFASGAGISDPNMKVALGAPTVEAVYRRLDGVQDYGDVKNSTVLRNLAMQDFSFALNPAHEITMTVDANRITDFFITFTPGTAIWLEADLISHQIDSAQEVVQMDVTVTNEGDIKCALGLNQIYAGTAGIDEA